MKFSFFLLIIGVAPFLCGSLLQSRCVQLSISLAHSALSTHLYRSGWCVFDVMLHCCAINFNRFIHYFAAAVLLFNAKN